MPHEMKPVQSSNISEVGYDSESKTLRVRFKGGGLYELDCEPHEHEAFLNSGSLGRHYHQNFRSRNAKRIE